MRGAVRVYRYRRGRCRNGEFLGGAWVRPSDDSCCLTGRPCPAHGTTRSAWPTSHPAGPTRSDSPLPCPEIRVGRPEDGPASIHPLPQHGLEVSSLLLVSALAIDSPTVRA